MSSLSNTTILKIENICYSVVASHFSFFCDSTNRGDNFTWDKFPRLVRGFVDTQINLAAFSKRDMKYIKEYAENFSTNLSNEMIRNSGYGEL